jgi:hypothetical protein
LRNPLNSAARVAARTTLVTATTSRKADSCHCDRRCVSENSPFTDLGVTDGADADSEGSSQLERLQGRKN